MFYIYFNVCFLVTTALNFAHGRAVVGGLNELKSVCCVDQAYFRITEPRWVPSSDGPPAWPVEGLQAAAGVHNSSAATAAAVCRADLSALCGLTHFMLQQRWAVHCTVIHAQTGVRLP